MRRVLAVLALCLLLPMVGGAQVSSYPATGGSSTLLCVSSAATATSGTAEEVLGTCTLPANTLHTNDMVLRFSFWGTHAANGNSVTVRVRIGGIAGTALVTSIYTTSAGGFVVHGEMARITQNTQISGSQMLAASSVSAVVTGSSVDLAAENTLVFTGQTGTAAGDFTLRGFTASVLSR